MAGDGSLIKILRDFSYNIDNLDFVKVVHRQFGKIGIETVKPQP